MKAFWNKVRKADGCWDWMAYKNACGYGVIGIAGKATLAHRLSYELHRGEIPSDMCVCHSCDNPGCVNPDHLWVGSRKDNMVDMAAKGRAPGKPGEKNFNAKLCEVDVGIIRSVGSPARKVAEFFDVSVSTIYKVRDRSLWASV